MIGKHSNALELLTTSEICRVAGSHIKKIMLGTTHRDHRATVKMLAA